MVELAAETGGLPIEAIPTPGHSDDMVCFVVRDELGEEFVFSGDTLFKDSIGGGNFEQIRRAVMDVYMEMPTTGCVMPGHTDRRRSAANGRTTLSCGCGAARIPRAPSRSRSAAATRR